MELKYISTTNFPDEKINELIKDGWEVIGFSSSYEGNQRVFCQTVFYYILKKTI